MDNHASQFKPILETDVEGNTILAAEPRVSVTRSIKLDERAKANELAQHADIFMKQKELVYSGLSPRIKYL